jgi:hypothetical protein
MVVALPGSAGKSMSASMTPDEYACGLMIETQLPGLPVVDWVASPLESVPTQGSGSGHHDRRREHRYFRSLGQRRLRSRGMLGVLMASHH